MVSLLAFYLLNFVHLNCHQGINRPNSINRAGDERTLTHESEISFYQAVEELENKLCNIVTASGYAPYSSDSGVDSDVLCCRSPLARKVILDGMAPDNSLGSKHADFIQYSVLEKGTPRPDKRSSKNVRFKRSELIRYSATERRTSWPDKRTSLRHARSKSDRDRFYSRNMNLAMETWSTPAKTNRHHRAQFRKLRTSGNRLTIWGQSQQHKVTGRYQEIWPDYREIQSQQNQSLIRYPIWESDKQSILDFQQNRIEFEEEKIPLSRITGHQDSLELRSIDVPRIEVAKLGGQTATSEIRSPEALPEIVNIKTPMGIISDNVVLRLMTYVSSLFDLFGCALVNKQFFRIYKENELSLIKNALFQMSPAAWELREMSPPWGKDWQGLEEPDMPVPEYTPTTYLESYGRDIYILAKLKSLIIFHCASFLRQDTTQGLAGTDPVRAADLDEALWRIWIFCRIFGSGKGRETNVREQIDWLNGGALAHKLKYGATLFGAGDFGNTSILFDPPAAFGKANGPGLTTSQLYDMSELWNALGVLLLEKVHRKYIEAQKAGIFCNLDIPFNKEELMLEEWTCYVLSFGPSVLLHLISGCPSSSTSTFFAKAQQMRLTEWNPLGGRTSRQMFIRDAIARTLCNKLNK
jgi:hypothetical protein